MKKCCWILVVLLIFTINTSADDNKKKFKKIQPFVKKTAVTVVKNTIDWLKKPTPGYQHQVFFTITYVETPAKWVGFSQGQMLLDKGKTRLRTRKDKQEVYFSDRRWHPVKPSSGLLPGPGPQHFDYRKPELWYFELRTDGKIFLYMRTWQKKFTVKLDIKGDVLCGTIGKNVVIISLKKDKYMIPK